MYSIDDIIDYTQCPRKLLFKDHKFSDDIVSYQELMALVMSRMARHLVTSGGQSELSLTRKLNLLWSDIRGRIKINLAPQYFLRLLSKLKKIKQDIFDRYDLKVPVFLESSRVYTTAHYSVGLKYSLFKTGKTYLAIYIDSTAQKILARSHLPIVSNLIHYDVVDYVGSKEKIAVNIIAAQHLTVIQCPVVPRIEVDDIVDNLCDAMQYNFNPRPTLDCSLCRHRDICKWKHE